MIWPLKGISNEQKRLAKQAKFRRSLIRHEAKMGGQLFGLIEPGRRREFFCLDRRTWVWHEEWTDQTGKSQIMTTRYDVRPSGILKTQGVNQYTRLSQEETHHFQQAVNLYVESVNTEYQRMLAA